MSDPHLPTDPADQAYLEAEAMLADEAARAARRARVLAAVAREAPAPAETPPRRRSATRPLGWLVAASVAAIAVLITTQSDLAPRLAVPRPAPRPAAQPSVTTATPVPQATAPAAKAAAQPALTVAAPERKAQAAARPEVPAPPPPPAAEGAFRAAPAPQVPPLPVPPVEHRIEEPRPPAPAPPVASADRQDLTVTGQRVPRAAAQAAPAIVRAPPPGSTSIQEMVVTQEHRALTGPPAERLRAAAAAGRTEDIEVLLAAGAEVDAADADGETPLMKAVQAQQTAAAALLRRHGASLKRKNHAGVSAQDMAAQIANPDMSRALGIKP